MHTHSLRQQGADLGDGSHLDRDVADAEAGLGDPAARDGYVVPQPMVAVIEPPTGGAAVREHHVQDRGVLWDLDISL